MYFITNLVIDMYDTINFKISVEDVRNTDFLQETPCYIHNVATHDYNGEQVVTGSLEGLNISVSKNNVRVKDGSLCKWYLGDNLKSLGRDDTKKAIEKLSDTLHLPMHKAVITRLDMALNIITKYPTQVYFNHLGLLKHTQRLEQPTGLYYNKNDIDLCFYDKIKEQKNKGYAIPELYDNRNVLRIEHRYKQRLKSNLGVEAVTSALLYDEAFYINIINRLKDTYNNINKINIFTMNFKEIKGKQQFYKMGILTSIEKYGLQNMINQITEAQLKGELTPKQAYDLRQVVYQACKDEALTIKSDAITELDKKVIDGLRFYR